MALMAWDDGYSVKVRRFDEQHKKLMEIVNKLHITQGIMIFLRDWLVQHIREEDAKYASFMNAKGVA